MKKFFYGLTVCLMLIVGVFALTGCGETIESLGIKNGVIKTEYIVGEAFDKSSGVLVAKIGSRYVDIALTDPAVTIEGFSTEVEVASATATIKYKGKSCTFGYSVSLKRVEGANVKGVYTFTYDGTNVKSKIIQDIFDNQTAGINKADIVLADLEGKTWEGIIDVPNNTNQSVNISVKVQKQGYASYNKAVTVIVNKKDLIAKLFIVDKLGNKQTVGAGNAVEYNGADFDLAIEYVGLAQADEEKFKAENQSTAGARPFICTSTKTSSSLDTSFSNSTSSSRKTVGRYTSGIVINSSLLHNYTLKGESNCATISTDQEGKSVVSYSNGFNWEIQKATLSDEAIESIKAKITYSRYSIDNTVLPDSTYIGTKQMLTLTSNFAIGDEKVIPEDTNNIKVAYYDKADATKYWTDGVTNAGKYKVVYTISYKNYKDLTIEKDFEITPKAIEIVWKSINDIDGATLTSDPNFEYDGTQKGVIAVVVNMNGIYSGDLDAEGRLSCLVTDNGTGTEKAQRTAQATLSSNNYIFKDQVEGYAYLFVWSIV